MAKRKLTIIDVENEEVRNVQVVDNPAASYDYGSGPVVAKTLNPEVEVNCLVCPPDEHPKDLWCRWEFKL